jgi:hypothetical protein
MIAGQRRQRPLGPADPRNPTAKRQGLTRLQLAELVALQAGKCALCERPLGARFAVDHDHELAASHGHNPRTGCLYCVRGALCHGCNRWLHTFRDTPAFLVRAARYAARLRGTG